MKNRVCCALCQGEAATYCSSDSAFLCMICDAKVHQANFLVARHVRQIICSICDGFTEDHISGMGFQSSIDHICLSCSPPSPPPQTGVDEDDLDSCLSSESSSSATAGSREKTCSRGRNGQARRPLRVDFNAEGLLVNWCTRLGLISGEVDKVVKIACDALGVCLEGMTVLPFRVLLVAALWFGFRSCKIKSMSTSQGMKKLEEMSGVPAKVIVAAEAKLERIFKATKKQRGQRQHQQQLEEGWAESST